MLSVVYHTVFFILFFFHAESGESEFTYNSLRQAAGFQKAFSSTTVTQHFLRDVYVIQGCQLLSLNVPIGLIV